MAAQLLPAILGEVESRPFQAALSGKGPKAHLSDLAQPTSIVRNSNNATQADAQMKTIQAWNHTAKRPFIQNGAEVIDWPESTEPPQKAQAGGTLAVQ
jgi:hypothetical protein